MSNNNFTCRDKYYNYGSYLRSRGYDKEICNLVTDIENGNIKIGPITPGNCASNKPTTIEGDVIIKKCAGEPNTGILTINGGVVGTDTGSLIDTTYSGLQVLNGAKISGPIYQTTDCSHSNYFSAGNHVFQGGNWGIDCSANVIINGDLSVTGDVSYTNLTVYDLSVSNTITVGNNVDISNNLLIGGNIVGTNGDLIIGGFTGDVYIAAGAPHTYDKNIYLHATDVSFNVDNVYFLDASVNFTKNPIITNDISGTSRTLPIFGETISILDVSGNTGTAGSHDLSFNILYSNVSNSPNIFHNNIIDFSNNQAYFENSILEVSYSVKADFSNPADALSVSFKDVTGPSELYLDTRSIKNGLGARTICFGPQTFIFKTGYMDNNYIQNQWKLHYDISGGTISTTDGRLTIKQKSLV